MLPGKFGLAGKGALAMERKLAAILAADVVGYSAHMERDEAGTFERLRAGRKELFAPEIEETIGLCDRVRIMFRGNSIREFQKGEATKVDVALWVSGGDNTSLHHDGG